jgi:hypothetical protein
VEKYIDANPETPLLAVLPFAQLARGPRVENTRPFRMRVANAPGEPTIGETFHIISFISSHYMEK